MKEFQKLAQEVYEDTRYEKCNLLEKVFYLEREFSGVKAVAVVLDNMDKTIMNKGFTWGLKSAYKNNFGIMEILWSIMEENAGKLNGDGTVTKEEGGYEGIDNVTELLIKMDNILEEIQSDSHSEEYIENCYQKADDSNKEYEKVREQFLEDVDNILDIYRVEDYDNSQKYGQYGFEGETNLAMMFIKYGEEVSLELKEIGLDVFANDIKADFGELPDYAKKGTSGDDLPL